MQRRTIKYIAKNNKSYNTDLVFFLQNYESKLVSYKHKKVCIGDRSCQIWPPNNIGDWKLNHEGTHFFRYLRVSKFKNNINALQNCKISSNIPVFERGYTIFWIPWVAIRILSCKNILYMSPKYSEVNKEMEKRTHKNSIYMWGLRKVFKTKQSWKTLGKYK